MGDHNDESHALEMKEKLLVAENNIQAPPIEQQQQQIFNPQLMNAQNEEQQEQQQHQELNLNSKTSGNIVDLNDNLNSTTKGDLSSNSRNDETSVKNNEEQKKTNESTTNNDEERKEKKKTVQIRDFSDVSFEDDALKTSTFIQKKKSAMKQTTSNSPNDRSNKPKIKEDEISSSSPTSGRSNSPTSPGTRSRANTVAKVKNSMDRFEKKN